MAGGAVAGPRRLPDVVAPGLRALLVGINPLLVSARVSHPFASPGNPFWRLLHAAGLTPELLRPEEDRRVLEVGLGLTNVCPRPTRSAAELTRAEVERGVRARRPFSVWTSLRRTSRHSRTLRLRTRREGRPQMITKPAVLECTRCGKIFIGYDRDVRPKGWPKCLKCSAREAWATLTGVAGAEKSSARRPRERRTGGRAGTTRSAGARRGAARKRR